VGAQGSVRKSLSLWAKASSCANRYSLQIFTIGNGSRTSIDLSSSASRVLFRDAVFDAQTDLAEVLRGAFISLGACGPQCARSLPERRRRISRWSGPVAICRGFSGRTGEPISSSIPYGCKFGTAKRAECARRLLLLLCSHCSCSPFLLRQVSTLCTGNDLLSFQQSYGLRAATVPPSS